MNDAVYKLVTNRLDEIEQIIKPLEAEYRKLALYLIGPDENDDIGDEMGTR